MDDKHLRRRLIHLAYEKPELRGEILPLVKQANPRAWNEAANLINRGMWQGKFSIDSAVEEVRDAYASALRALSIHERTGVGNTEAPSLLLRIIEPLEDLQDVVQRTLNGLKKWSD